jgi:hypothetical protein
MSLRCASWTLGLLALLSIGACTSDPEIHTCVVQEDCPASLFCLQQVCESTPLPSVRIVFPEDSTLYPWKNDGTAHSEMLMVQATDLTLRPQSESSERIVGEGYLVVFVDEVEVATIEDGDLASGVWMDITFEDSPGVHRLRVQARLNDGTDYDNREGAARSLIWVDDGLQHVAFRRPWPGDVFPLEEQAIEAEVAVMGGAIEIGPPESGLLHGKVYYDAEPFDECLMNPSCYVDYRGIVPSDDDEFGPVFLPRADAAGTVDLTVAVSTAYHEIHMYEDGMGMERTVYSSIQIERSDD